MYEYILRKSLENEFCGAGAGGAEIIMRPGAGAEIVSIINIFCSQFGGC